MSEASTGIRLKPSVSVVIATYNDDHRLQLALHGWAAQTDRDFELFVVNDGAPRPRGEDSTKLLVESFSDRMNIRYLYAEPESTDYRLPKALNWGIRHASGKTLLISDGDCVPASQVVSLTREHARDDRVVIGIRKRIPMEAVPYITPTDLGLLENLVLGQDRRLQDPKFADIFGRLRDEAPWGSWILCWGCLFSGPLEKFKALGGFDEEFVGWGGDDEDMGERLVRGMGCKFLGLPEYFVYHLNHEDRESSAYVLKLQAVRENWQPVRNDGPIL